MTKREEEVDERLKKCGRTVLIKMIAKLEHDLEIKESFVEMQAEIVNFKLDQVVSKQTIISMLVEARKEYEKVKKMDKNGSLITKFTLAGEISAYTKLLEVGK